MAKTKLEIHDRFGGQMPTGQPHDDIDHEARKRIVSVPVTAKDGKPSHTELEPAPEPKPEEAKPAEPAPEPEQASEPAQEPHEAPKK